MAVIKMNFLSKSLGFQTNLSVVLPTLSMKDVSEGVKDYYQPGMKYQVLYLLHGGGGDSEDYIKFSNIVRYAEAHRVCVVMPSGYNARYSDAGWGPRCFQYLAEELPLVCRSLFPISEAREDVFVAGLSMGAQGAMKLGAMYPERYSAVLCMSGAAFNPDKVRKIRRPIEAGEEGPDSMPVVNAEALWGDLDKFKGSVHDAWHYARMNMGKEGPKPEYYFTVGDLDINRDVVDDAYEYLTGLGYSTHYELVPGYGHEWDFWDLTFNRKGLLVLSFAGLGLVFVGYALSENIWMLLLMRILHGMFFCLCTTVNLTMVADLVPEKKLARGLGYYGLCYTLMSAVGPGIGLKLIEAAGYRKMFLCAAASYAAACGVSLSIRAGGREGKQREGGREKAQKERGWRPMSLGGLFSRSALPASSIAFFNAFTNGAVVSFILLYAAEKGFANAGMFFSIYAVVIVASRPLLGRLADELKPQYLVFPCDGLIIASMLLLFAGKGEWCFYLAAVLYGVGYGGLQPLLQSMGLRRAQPEERGKASGTFNMGLDAGNGLGPVLCSTAAGIWGGYRYGFLVMVVPVFFGACIMAELARQEKRRALTGRTPA